MKADQINNKCMAKMQSVAGAIHKNNNSLPQIQGGKETFQKEIASHVILTPEMVCQMLPHFPIDMQASASPTLQCSSSPLSSSPHFHFLTFPLSHFPFFQSREWKQ